MSCKSCYYPIGVSLLVVASLLLYEGVALDLRNKPAEQSSVAFSHQTADKAVDGDLESFQQTQFSPSRTSNPWWKVDLEAIYCLKKVTVVNRQLTCSDCDERLRGAVVRAGLNSHHTQNAVIGSPVTNAQAVIGKVTDFVANQIVSARYVSVDIPGDNKRLHVAEVLAEEFIDIEATVASTAVALNGSTATQSSTLDASDGDEWAASKALDGALQYDSPHCSRTNFESNPWWKVKLKSEQCLVKIILKVRDADYVSDRLLFEDAVVRAGQSSQHTNNMMCGSAVSAYQAAANNWMEFACNPSVNARYISVDIPRVTQLALCEVLVTLCNRQQEADNVDITLVTNPALIGQSGNDAALAVYKGPSGLSAGVSFGRQLTTGGSNDGLPSGSVEAEDPSLGCTATLLRLPEDGGIDRTGVFYSEAIRNGVMTRIQTIILANDQNIHIRPIQRTQTVNIGDAVVLAMQKVNSPNSNYRWRHNDGDIVALWNDTLSVSIADVALADGGVYSCFALGQEEQQLHGVMRLIVRSCSAGMWDPPSCDNNCRRCYNGGVCDDKTGTCICAPGFSGKHCETAHGGNVFGQNADHVCSNTTESDIIACRGRLFCLPDPYGCSCAAGYTGLDCMQDCDDGMFGADCKQTCHCAAGDTCNKNTGECTNGVCEESYFGSNCQCSSQEASPGDVMAISVMQRNLSFSWSEPTCGLRGGAIAGYTYKLTESNSGAELRSSSTPETLVTMDGLIPYTDYNFEVAATNSEGAGLFGEGVVVRTEEAEPTAPKNLSIYSVDEESITVEWMEPYPPHGIITNHDVVYWVTGDDTSRMEQTNIGIRRLFEIGGLSLNVTYSIQVRAKTVAGTGPWSEVVNETVVGVPGPIQNLRLTEKSDVALTLDWDPPINLYGPIPRYLVEYKALNKPYQPGFNAMDSYTVIEVDRAPFRKDNLEPGTKYEFRVAAHNQRNTGAFMVLAAYTRPLENPPIPATPLAYTDETTDTTVTIGLTRSPGDKYVQSYVVRVTKASSMARRDVLMTGNYNESTVDYIAAEFLKQSVPNKFIVGDDKMYGGYFNAPLQTGAAYNIRVGSVSRGDDMEASVTFSDPITETVTQPNNPAAVVGAVVAVIVVLLIVIVIIVVYKRKICRSEQPSGGDGVKMSQDVPLDHEGDMTQGISFNNLNEIHESSTATMPHSEPEPKPRQKQPFKQPQPVRVGDLARYIDTKKSAAGNGFTIDYKTLPEGQLHPWTVASKSENKQKNRFANVIAYDHSRVVLTLLENDPYSDYINACYIDGYRETDKYIASQGPNKASLRDLWRMVWELNVDKIVMLTNPVENGKTKCLQYWPNTGATTYADISVTIIKEKTFLDYTVRFFNVNQVGSEERSRLVRQFHYTTWPDMKPPEHPAPLLNFMRVVNAQHNERRTVVHCSAGVGRTGTYIALDSMLEQMKQEGQVDVLGFIYRMRQKRIKMVQTSDQYRFIFDTLLVASLAGDTTYDVADFRQQLTALKTIGNDSKQTGIDKQFKDLSRLVLSCGSGSSNSGKLPENVGKNRFPDFIPIDRARPYLMIRVKEDDTNYINANFLPGYRRKDRYIATQMPMPNTVADIWRLVYDQNVTCIIMLNPLDEDDDTMCRYWPEEGPVEFGPLVVEPLQTTTYKGVTGQTFKLRNSKEKPEATRTVCQFQCRDWPSDQEVPDSWQGMLTLMELTQKWHEEEAPIVVHCVDGLGRTAVYCTLMSLLEQLQEEKMVDVFQAVLRFRMVNRSMMYSADHYAMCYEVLQAYLDSSVIYENLDVASNR